MIVGLCGVAGSGKDTVADFLVKNHGFVKVAFADPLKRICKEVFDFSDEQLWGPSEKRNEPDKRYPRWPNNECPWCAKAGQHRKPEHRYIEHLDYEGLACPKCDLRVDYLTPRYALQQLGSEWGRDCYQNVWVDYALRIAREVLDEGVEYYASRGTTIEKADEPAKGVVISDVRFRNEVDCVQKRGGKVVKIVRKDAGLKGSSAQHTSETEQLSIPDDVFDHHLINGGTSFDLLEAAVRGLVGTLGLE